LPTSSKITRLRALIYSLITVPPETRSGLGTYLLSLRKVIDADACIASQGKIMTLADYRKVYDVPLHKIASSAGVHPSTLYRYQQGEGRPSPEVLLRIVEMTGGLVTLEEMLAEFIRARVKRKRKKGAAAVHARLDAAIAADLVSPPRRKRRRSRSSRKAPRIATAQV
jgi:transcriptional regulator with XRE-family HTH domain